MKITDMKHDDALEMGKFSLTHMQALVRTSLSVRLFFEKLPNMDIANIEELDKLLPWSKDLPANCLAKQK